MFVFRGGSMELLWSEENKRTVFIFINFILLVISILLIGGTWILILNSVIINYTVVIPEPDTILRLHSVKFTKS